MCSLIALNLQIKHLCYKSNKICIVKCSYLLARYINSNENSNLKTNKNFSEVNYLNSVEPQARSV